jgi:hypothetical protein
MVGASAMPDITEYLNFPFYGWVKFIDHTEHDGRTLGRWLGPSENVGSKLTYYILKDNGKVVSRSSVIPLTRQELTRQKEISQQLTKRLELSLGSLTKILY